MTEVNLRAIESKLREAVTAEEQRALHNPEDPTFSTLRVDEGEVLLAIPHHLSQKSRVHFRQWLELMLKFAENAG